MQTDAKYTILLCHF